METRTPRLKFLNLGDSTTVFIIGSGASMRKQGQRVMECVKKRNAKTIGINFMTNICHPDFHLWTNTQRFLTYGGCIDPNQSTVLLSKNIKKTKIKKVYKGPYVPVMFTDNRHQKLSMDPVHITGQFRTAGVLAIVIAKILGAKEIYIAGMDGYSFTGKNQHVYGKGKTDGTSDEKGREKDKIVYRNLKRLAKHGIEFSIVTPTVFDRFYNPGLLK